MNDPIPHNRNRLGYILGYIFHPLVLFIPTLIVVLNGTAFPVAAGWVAFISVMILVPTLYFIFHFRQQGKHIYQREHRHILYITFWVMMFICTGVAILLDAPSRLVFSLVCLLIWTPIQFGVNFYFTKISGHTAVVAGIVTAFWVMGILENPWLKLLAIAVVFLVAWARIVTGNHTLKQAALGIVVSSGSALIAALLTGGN